MDNNGGPITSPSDTVTPSQVRTGEHAPRTSYLAPRGKLKGKEGGCITSLPDTIIPNKLAMAAGSLAPSRRGGRQEQRHEGSASSSSYAAAASTQHWRLKYYRTHTRVFTVL